MENKLILVNDNGIFLRDLLPESNFPHVVPPKSLGVLLIAKKPVIDLRLY